MMKASVFPRAKGKLVLTSILYLALAGLLFLIVYAFREESFFVALLFIGLGFLPLYSGLRNLLHLIIAEPYVILTNEAMILQPNRSKEAQIEWKDITGFRVEYHHFQLTIHIGLKDETKYGFKEDDPHRGFYIRWNEIARKEKDHFIEVVHQLTESHVNHLEHLLKQELLNKREREWIGVPYFLRAYGISLIITFIYGYFNIWDASILLYIFLFLIFPLGKILYDKLFGFFLLHRLDAETGITAGMNRLFVLPIGFWFIVHFFIIFLAPIGFILLIILLYKQRKWKKEEEKT